MQVLDLVQVVKYIMRTGGGVVSVMVSVWSGNDVVISGEGRARHAGTDVAKTCLLGRRIGGKGGG